MCIGNSLELDESREGETQTYNTHTHMVAYYIVLDDAGGSFISCSKTEDSLSLAHARAQVKVARSFMYIKGTIL